MQTAATRRLPPIALGPALMPLSVTGKWQTSLPLAGCLHTAQEWEKLIASPPCTASRAVQAQLHYTAARIRSVCAALLSGAGNADQAARQRELALDHLRQAVAAGYSNTKGLNAQAEFDPLRSRPEFQQLVVSCTSWNWNPVLRGLSFA